MWRRLKLMREGNEKKEMLTKTEHDRHLMEIITLDALNEKS